MAAKELAKPRFWYHLKQLVLYPLYLYRYRKELHRLDMLNEQKIALIEERARKHQADVARWKELATVSGVTHARALPPLNEGDIVVPGDLGEPAWVRVADKKPPKPDVA